MIRPSKGHDQPNRVQPVKKNIQNNILANLIFLQCSIFALKLECLLHEEKKNLLKNDLA